MADHESELTKRVRYGIGLVSSNAEDYQFDPRAQIQLRVCDDVELVLDRLEEALKENDKLRQRIAEFENK